MNTRGVAGKALLVSALLIALALGASFWLVTAELQRLYNEDLTRQLLATARILGDTCGDDWTSSAGARITEMALTLHAEGTKLIIMTTDGRILVDTTDGAELPGDLLAQPEARQALRVGHGAQTRRLRNEQHARRIVAIRIDRAEATRGLVWLARPAWTARTAWASLGKLIVAISAIAAVSTLTLALVLMYVRQRLLRRLTRTAWSLSTGDLSAQADIGGDDEWALLASALNRMRRRLAAQVVTIDRERATLEALVHQLGEGVVVARPDGTIALINPAAHQLLNLATTAKGDHRSMIGSPVEHCIPQHDLQRMLRGEKSTSATTKLDNRTTAPPSGDTPGHPSDQEACVQIETSAGMVHLLARASNVGLPGDTPTAKQPATGRMVVLTDITQLTNAMRIKTDFVTNASHELRTPLSTIRAAVETLLQMNLTEDATTAERFLQAIKRQSGRLEALVSDLLNLARLESATTRFEPEALDAQQLLDELHERFVERLQTAQLRWEARCEAGGGPIVVHPYLLRLVLDNLVDNALKFTEAGGHVRVVCTCGPSSVKWEVSDDGCGIPECEQERVFERFYQVERARSGHERGTGLGLSIVRHAVAAMRGIVSLKSVPGQGTCVTVRIPQPTDGCERSRPDGVLRAPSQ
ncbi:MAG: HAMP domain-containing protein [Planctomycetes bacterium]|nr:HAMP domain-containing protein [Planctomycetota bacterium]